MSGHGKPGATARSGRLVLVRLGRARSTAGPRTPVRPRGDGSLVIRAYTSDGTAYRGAVHQVERAATDTRPPFTDGAVDVHLRMRPHADDRRTECADLLCSVRGVPADRASRYAGRLLERYPGCLLACVRLPGGTGCLVRARAGRSLLVLALPPGAVTEEQTDGLASFLYAWTVCGMPAESLRTLRLEGGGGGTRVRLRVFGLRH
ncbi:hypothetical protein [Streptomyces sp. NPDC054784]